MGDTYRMGMAKKIRRVYVDELGRRPSLELCAVLFDMHQTVALAAGYRKDEEIACYIFDVEEATLRLSAEHEPQGSVEDADVTD